MTPIKTLFVHYTAPPVVGGVEAVIEAHARVFQAAGYPVTIAAGRGEASALPAGTGLERIPEMDTQHADILDISAGLEQGYVPPGFAPLRDRLTAALRPIVRGFDVVIVHNIFTKHFNLPLTAALMRLLEEEGQHQRWLAWCHDLTWTSEHAREKVFPGRPWDLLRAYRPDLHYVTVSEQRRT